MSTRTEVRRADVAVDTRSLPETPASTSYALARVGTTYPQGTGRFCVDRRVRC